ncbi:MAG TPA: AtpZ/AtpI family protein [Longimicrobiales bacterium]|nr:AtpZ/AtpI family protein [Longimicrobiales bacterium]
MPEKYDRNDERKAGPSAWAASGKYAGLGLQLAAAIGLFLWLGWLADHRLGTTPLFTIVGAFVGAGGGFYSLYRQLILDTRNGDEPDR